MLPSLPPRYKLIFMLARVLPLLIRINLITFSWPRLADEHLLRRIFALQEKRSARPSLIDTTTNRLIWPTTQLRPDESRSYFNRGLSSLPFPVAKHPVNHRKRSTLREVNEFSFLIYYWVIYLSLRFSPRNLPGSWVVFLPRLSKEGMDSQKNQRSRNSFRHTWSRFPSLACCIGVYVRDAW